MSPSVKVLYYMHSGTWPSTRSVEPDEKFVKSLDSKSMFLHHSEFHPYEAICECPYYTSAKIPV